MTGRRRRGLIVGRLTVHRTFKRTAVHVLVRIIRLSRSCGDIAMALSVRAARSDRVSFVVAKVHGQFNGVTLWSTSRKKCGALRRCGVAELAWCREELEGERLEGRQAGTIKCADLTLAGQERAVIPKIAMFHVHSGACLLSTSPFASCHNGHNTSISPRTCQYRCEMLLPMPGSPSASWRLYVERLRSTFEAADKRVAVAFWLFGLINNSQYPNLHLPSSLQ